MLEKKNITRSYYIDNGSGILIVFLVLLYHLPVYCEINDSEVLVNLRNMLDFFMAWFFYKSGMFHKERTIKDEFIKCWRRLLIPYLIINLCCALIHIIFFREGVHITEIIKVALYNECEDLCYPLWFCLSLAIVRLGYQIINNKANGIKLPFAVFTLACAFLMYLYSYKLGDDSAIKSFLPFSIPYWFGNIFLGFFFYSLGDLLQEKQFNRYLYYVALLIYVAHLFFPVFLNFWYNLSNSYLLSVLYYVSGIIVFNNVLNRWLNKRVPLLTHIGENSMIYYITHGTFLELLFSLSLFKAASGWPLYIVAFILTILYLLGMDILFRKTKFKVLIGG